MLKAIFSSWLFEYRKEYFLKDVFGGLTVGVLLIPQGMAYAILAGLPPVYGLYASIVPGIVYSLFGTSRHLSVGPVAMDSLLVASFLGTLAHIGPEYYIALSFMLAALMGAVQVILGLLRMGFIVNFLSKPVISGFTSAASIIIGASQIKYILGVNPEGGNLIHDIFHNIYEVVDQYNLYAMGLGIGSMVIIYALRKWLPKIPSALVIVVLSSLVVWGANLESNNIDIVGAIPSGLPSFQIPVFDMDLLQEMVPMVLTLAVIAFMEAISVAKTVEAHHDDYEVNPNKELVAIGLSNLIGSFFMSYPITGGFSRTAVSDASGTRTPLAALIAVGMVVLTLLFFTSWFYFLPKAALASIIIVAVSRLVNIQYPKELWKSRRVEFWMLIATFIFTLFVGITYGIAVGVGLSLMVMIYLTTKPHMVELGQLENTNQFRCLSRFENVIVRPDVLITRFDAQMYFANSGYFKDQLEIMIKEKGKELKLIVLSMDSVNLIDSSAMIMLRELVADLKDHGYEFYFSGTIGPVRDTLHKSGFTKEVGSENFFMDVHFAIDHYDKVMAGEISHHDSKAVQTNH